MSAIYEHCCTTVVRKLLLDLWTCLKTATHLRRNQRCTHPAIKPYHATTNHAPGDCVIMTSMRDHGRLPLSMQPRHLSWTISYVNLPWKYVNAGVDFYETLNHTSRKTWTTLPKQNKAKRRLNNLQSNGVLRHFLLYSPHLITDNIILRVERLIGLSLTSLFSTNTAISETTACSENLH